MPTFIIGTTNFTPIEDTAATILPTDTAPNTIAQRDFDTDNSLEQWEIDLSAKITPDFSQKTRAKYQEKFATIADGNNDGIATEQEVDAVFDFVDTSKDGKLQRTEIKAAYALTIKDDDNGLTDTTEYQRWRLKSITSGNKF